MSEAAPNLNPYLGIPNYTNDGTWQSRFLGFPAMQNRNAAPCWSYLAELHPPARIIELGAYEGGFSCLLGILARNYHAACITYELGNRAMPEDWFAWLPIEWRHCDYHKDPELPALIQQSGITWLLCDGGNKEREWQTFATYLKPGDIIGAHDWAEDSETWCATEFYPPNATPVNIACDLRQITTPNFQKAAWYVCQRQLP